MTPSRPHQSLTGIVLAGGLSSRLGNDKTVLRLYGDTEPDMLTRSCSLLAEVTDKVCISGRTTNAQAPGYPCLKDEHEGLGPVGGIITALRATQGPIMVLSCDLPFMTLALLEGLTRHRQTERNAQTLMTTYLQSETGFIESLVAIYEYETLPVFEQAIQSGIYKLSRIIAPEFQVRIPYTSHEALPFFNINYPADLAMARRIIAAL